MSPQTQRFRFGEFVLDAEGKILLRDRNSVPIPPKVFELLLVLVENPGHVVGKEALMERLWSDTFVEEGNLTFSVRKLRTILGDDTHNPRFIETVPKRGYRFIAEVSLDDSGVLGSSEIITHDKRRFSGQTDATQPAIQSLLSRYSYALPVTISAILIAGLIAASWWSSANRTTTVSALKIERLTYNGKAKLATISPNGKFAAYVLDDEGNQSIWVKNVATGSDLQILPPADGIELHEILFSRDGDQLYYIARDSLYQVPILGGVPKEVLHNFAAGLLYKSITLSPDGKQFAFIRPVSQNETSLIIADSDGSNERLVASSQGKGMFRRSVSWSPDGAKIALVSAGESNINVVDVANGAVSAVPSPSWKNVWKIAWQTNDKGLLVEAVEGRSLSSQIWSLSYPDGKAERITNDFHNYDGIASTSDGKALITVRVEQAAHIWVTSEFDMHPRQLTHGIEGYDGIYALNYLSSGDVIYEVTSGERRDIWSVNPDGTGARQILTDAGSSAVSPDGKYIVFQGGETNDKGLFRHDIKTGEKVRLTNGNDVWTTLSSDGKWVVFTRWKANATIWKVGIEGGEAVQLSNQPGYALAPTVSPDSKMIAFHWAKTDRAKAPEIAVIPFDGGEIIQTFPAPPNWSRGIGKQALQWTPDGRFINYTAYRDNASNIWSQPLDGAKPIKVTNFADQQIYNFAYQPNSTKLALSRGPYGRDVVLLKLN